MNVLSDNVRTLVREIKRRWVVRAMKQGLAVCFLAFLLLAAFYLLMLYRFDPIPFWQTVIVGMSLVILAILAVLYVIRPLFTRFSDQKIAMFIEEKFPELEDRLNSAVEIDMPSLARERSVLVDMLIADAAQKAGLVRISTVVDRSKEKILTWTAYSLLALTVLFVYSFRSELGSLTSRMAFLVGSAAGYQPEISISPGDKEVEVGESQEVLATLRRQSSDEVFLHYRTRSGEWHRESMTRGLDGREYLYQFTSIQEPITYYVEFRELVSPEYDITVYEYPKVMQIDLAYDYPDYTGMPDKREDNTGNIRALVGTTVTLTVTTAGRAVSGELVIDDTSVIPLAPQGGGVFSASLTVEDYGTYLVRLTDTEDKHNKFPEEYLITPVEDEWPLITITDPKRDLRVNPLEEVVIAATTEDDYGIRSLRLVYTVNGGDEESVDLAGDIDEVVHDVSGSHVLYLEDYALVPGDVVAYYLESEDTYHTGEPSMTDMYFIEITPFDATFTQVNNQQSGMQQQQESQPQSSQMVTSQQMVIAATWKLHRLRNEKTEAEFDESLDALIQAQANLMYNINDRINSTAMSEELVTSEENRELADLLRNAVKEMGAALEDLAERDLMEALKPEQRALNNLLRADALNKERQVQMQTQMSQSGSQSGQSSEERMTELMDLELDISQDKYEIQQQNQTQQAEEMDEAMDKLRELAERQQELAQQNREDFSEMDEAEARRFLDRLQRDQEELRQQAEELSSQLREMARNNDQMSREMQERMEQVAETMREAEQDLKNNNIQESLAKQQQALNELNRLQQELQFSMSDDARERLGEFTENYESLRNREERFAEELNEANEESIEDSGRIDDQRLLELTAERQRILEQLRSLEEQAAAIEEQTLQENPDIAADMRNIRNAIRRENIDEEMVESERFLRNGWLSYSDALEEMILESLDALDEQIAGLEDELPVTDEERLARSLAEAREMRQRLEDMMAEAAGGQEPSEQDGERQAQSGSGQPRDNEDTEQTEQASQQAQSGQQSGQEQAENSGREQNQQQSSGSQPQNQQQQGSQQPQQGGGQPGENDRQQTAGGGGMSDRDAAVRLEQLMNQFDRMLDQMEQQFTEDTELQRTIETARQYATAAYTGELLGEDAEERFREGVFDPLSQLEIALQKRLDEIDLERKLYSMRNADVPPEYRSMVNRYFESLAKENSEE